MLRWALILAVLSAMLAVLGYSGLGGVFAEFAQMLLFIAVGATVVFLALGLLGRRRA